jgi:hypothetical protein
MALRNAFENLSTEATLASLKSVADALLIAAQAIQEATETISGNVSKADTDAVTISNFPVTQPVSIASMPSTPVTGTFYPETQPVSGQTTVPTTGTEIVPVCTLIGAPRGVGRMFTGSTIIANLTPFRGILTMSPMLATTVFPSTVCEAFIDDAIVVPPGGLYAIQAIGGAGTSPLVAFSIAYEECDLIQ